MKKIRKTSCHPLTIVLLILAFLNISCNQDDVFSNETQQKYTGEDIFKGIYFYDNDFLNNIPVLQNSIVYKAISKNPKLLKNIQNYSNIITEEISKDYPSFFLKFEQFMKSGNQVEIAKALKSASRLIVETYNKQLNESGYTYKDIEVALKEENLENLFDKNENLNEKILEETLKKYNSSNASYVSSGKCAAIVFAVYVAVVVVAGAAVAINVAAAINVAGAVNGYLAVNVETYGDINFGGGGGGDEDDGNEEEDNCLPHLDCEGYSIDDYLDLDLETEMLVNQLANINY